MTPGLVVTFEFSAALSYSFGLRYPRVEWRLVRL